MKSKLNVLPFSKWSFYALAIIIISLSACSKNEDSNSATRSRLMLFNLAADRPTIAYNLGAVQFSSAINYGNNSGSYIPFVSGTRDLSVVAPGGVGLIVTDTHVFTDDKYYSSFFVGLTGDYRQLIVEDKLNEITAVAGKAWVRFVNAVPNNAAAPDVTIGTYTAPAPFATASAFLQVNAGTTNVSIANANFNVSKTLSFNENRIYTVLFFGKPGATDASLAPQATMVENGIARQ